VCIFLEGWHAFLGGRTIIYCIEFGLLLLARISRVSIQQEGHINRGVDLCTCIGNSGTNFEEFGSDFEVETWHDFRDKSVFNFLN
jgi:hypothetical protein